MAGVGGGGLDGLTAAARTRRRALDPLLPDAAELPRDAGEPLVVVGADGMPVAAGVSRHVTLASGSLERLWAAVEQHRLIALVAGSDPVAALDRLLSEWRARLAGLPEPDDEDSAAVVSWPSRDAAGVPALLAHGLQPRTVLAVRPAGRASPTPESVSGVRIRSAGPDDIDAVADLWIRLVRYEAPFGSVILRSGTVELLTEAVAEVLAYPEPWVWLAERGGRPVAFAMVDPPERAGWIAPSVAGGPAAYVSCLYVVGEERGGGIGAALVAHVHQRLDDTGTAVTLLHYGQVNPLSVPFWSRMGYRPLWTSWQARPATALR